MAQRALLVGINAYPNPAHRLRGCLNDIRQLRAVLVDRFAFDPSAGLRVLSDSRATIAAVRDGIGWLVAGATAGDVLVLHFSGHGSQVRDHDGDERTDGLDETICPYDFDGNDPFTDDDLHALVKNVPEGVNLTVILDCCHAGTGLRDPAAGHARFLRKPWPVGAAVKGLDEPASRAPVRASTVPPLDSARPVSLEARGARRLHRFGERAAAAGALLVAACRADQVSADAYLDGAYHGALTFYFCRALAESGHPATCSSLVRRVGQLLRANGFDQVPQLEGPVRARNAPIFAPLRESERSAS